eukprot:scaffold6036_cov371-Prasinococcus_capsulatus_cf.AAC.9
MANRIHDGPISDLAADRRYAVCGDRAAPDSTLANGRTDTKSIRFSAARSRHGPPGPPRTATGRAARPLPGSGGNTLTRRRARAPPTPYPDAAAAAAA